MNKKKFISILIMIAILIFIFGITIYTVNAYGVKDLTGTDPDNTKAITIGNRLITVVTVIGAVVSVIVLIILGIKYMLGSVEEKAEYKKTLMPYIIGAVCVFAASAIASAIFNVAKNLG